jgi:uncharacterized membrane protein YbhN (UPF0104 family)
VRRAWIVLQVLATIAVFGFLLSHVDTAGLVDALGRSPAWSVPAAVLTMLCLMGISALRWAWLIRAYGSTRVPPLAQLFHLQLVGIFYNMLPGAVGGDVVRGIVSRGAFGERGALTGVAVVFVERVVGLIGLVLVVTGLLLLRPMPALEGLIDRRVLWLGLLAASAAIGAVAVGRRLSTLLPARIGTLLAALPELARPLAFAIAVAFSVANQLLVGVVAHAAIGPLAPSVGMLDSLVMAPIAFAAVFFPLTVAGAGTRDAAMVLLYGTLGVARETALGASLVVLLTYLVVAAIGGASTLAVPLSRYQSRDSAGADAPERARSR